MPNIESFDRQIDFFIKQNNLYPADAIVVKKLPLKLLDHYILYLGMYQYKHVFMANTLTGVRIFTYQQLVVALQTFQPEKIQKFVGTEQDRRLAVERALMRKDENSYHLILNNCEHYKNWVHNGAHESEQVENIGKAVTATGAAIVLGSKSDNGKLLGLGLMLFGGIAWALSNDERNRPPITQPVKQKK